MIVESPSNVNVVGQQLNKRKFDVIIIDHSGDRTSAVTDYLPMLSETGFVIFDNSDRSEYAAGLRLLREAGFSRLVPGEVLLVACTPASEQEPEIKDVCSGRPPFGRLLGQFPKSTGNISSWWILIERA
jgi:hypothetical protein